MKEPRTFKFLKKVALFIGIDKEIIWNIYNRIWTGIKGPISVFFILKFLMPEQQGLWYTFINLAALKMFAELGFTNIITQFVSHEYVHIKIGGGKKVEGTTQSVNRFFSLIKYSIKFYLWIVPIAIVIMMIVGYFYFKTNGSTTIVAWSIFSFIGGASLLLSLFQAIYKGIDKVKIIQKNLLIGSVSMGFGNWIFLTFKFGIWALILGNIFGLIIMLFHLYKIDPFFWNQIFKYKVKDKIPWLNEILRLQWRYAISWASGYFIFNLIVPVLYKYEDPTFAGKYGITYAIIVAVVGISQAWILTKVPKFNMLVALKKRRELNLYFKKSFIKSILIQISLSILLIIAFIIVFNLNIYSERFLNLKYIALLLIIQIPIQTVNFLAVYLRAHKEEPYVIYSILNALAISVGLFIVLPQFGFKWLMFFIALSYWLVLLPYAFIVFLKKRKQYIIKYYK